MAVLTPEQRAKLRADTVASCGPFLEDLRHLKKIVAADEHAGTDIRHMSAILRRFLVIDRLIQILGAPRNGRIKIREPDNKPIYKGAERDSLALFVSAGVTTHGITFRALRGRRTARPTRDVDFDPDRTIEVPADNFLDQRVVCFMGKWATRREVIQYVANVAHGVHAGKEKDDADRLIGRVRAAAKLSGEHGAVTLFFDESAIQAEPKPFAYDPKSVDVILLEVLAAAHFVVTSPDVLAVEAIVTRELGLPEP